MHMNKDTHSGVTKRTAFPCLTKVTTSMRAGNRLVSRTYGQTRRQWLALLSKSKQDKLQTNTTEVLSMQDCVYIVFNTLNETDAHTKPLSLTHVGNFCIWG